jgi:hypothetical protein
MQRDLSESEVLALQNDMDGINRSARVVPLRHSVHCGTGFDAI